jgi:molybdopterin-guanine dinucleotide biosynthesis protein A
MMPPLYGLVLAGGRSRRMGRDKVALAYHGETPHARYTADLLARSCERVFVSCRADQTEEDPSLASVRDLPRIADAFAYGGPLNGILSALRAHPQAAFLVAACDLPFLSGFALAQLARERNPLMPATAFWNPARESLEPLCAIYEPGFTEAAESSIQLGLSCPTKILEALDIEVLRPSVSQGADFLENANRPEDYARARARLSLSSGDARA